MSEAIKTPPTSLTFRAGTPKRVFDDLRRRYSRYLLDEEDPLLDYFETDIHKKIRATMKPGDWISNLRDAHGLTQSELGKKLGGVRASRISDWENNQRAVSKKYAKALSALLKVPAERFL